MFSNPKKLKWFLSISFVIIVAIVVARLSLVKTFSDFTFSYSHQYLYENAIDELNKNKRVQQLYGEVFPLGKMAILEGQTIYKDNYQKVRSIVKINAEKGTAKMDITAKKHEGIWVYESIKVRRSKSTEAIQITEIKPD